MTSSAGTHEARSERYFKVWTKNQEELKQLQMHNQELKSQLEAIEQRAQHYKDLWEAVLHENQQAEMMEDELRRNTPSTNKQDQA